METVSRRVANIGPRKRSLFHGYRIHAPGASYILNSSALPENLRRTLTSRASSAGIIFIPFLSSISITIAMFPFFGFFRLSSRLLFFLLSFLFTRARCLSFRTRYLHLLTQLRRLWFYFYFNFCYNLTLRMPPRSFVSTISSFATHLCHLSSHFG